MPTTTYYDVRKIPDAGYIKPISDYTYLAKISTLNLNRSIFYSIGDGVISGLAPSAASATVNLSAGQAFVSGSYMASAGVRSYVLPGGISNDTYQVYITPTPYSTGADDTDKSDGIFSIAHGGSTPSGSLYIAEIVVTGGVITTITDKRSFAPTISNHDHSGGTKGVQLTNSSIATGASIAYAKLNLSGSIVNADVSSVAAIAYSKLNLLDGVRNSDIHSAAAIAYSKLNLAGAVQYSDLANAAAKIELEDEGVSKGLKFRRLNFTGDAVTVVALDDEEATINITKLQDLDYLNDVEIVAPSAGQMLRYRGSEWVNESPTASVNGSQLVTVAAGATVKVTISHDLTTWATPPVPECSWVGDDVEVWLDLGKPFSNSEFTLNVKNIDSSSPTGSTTLSWTRKGLKA